MSANKAIKGLDVDTDYFVEAILQKHVIDNEIFFLVKWLGYDEPTWEPEKNLTNCDLLRADFEKSEQKKQARKQATKKKGFNRGFSAERIIGATDETGELFFLIKWKNSKKLDMVRAKEANVKWPQMVIKFYEERLVFEKKAVRV